MRNKRVGIWGFGISGKAAARFCQLRGAVATIFDDRFLTADEQQLARTLDARVWHNKQVKEFLAHQDLILPSPGIDLRPHSQFQEKFISEVDLFAHHFGKKIVAITGTIGKTTVTALLSHLQKAAGIEVAMGGNIGIPLLGLLELNPKPDIAVIELSSFQLELCTAFAPDVAVLTNLYPNHLDRHNSFEEYAKAKARLFAHQTVNNFAIMPITLAPLMHAPGRRIFTADQKPSQQECALLGPNDSVLFMHNNFLLQYDGKHETTLLHAHQLPTNSFSANGVTIAATLIALELPLTIMEHAATFTPHEHRVEKFATINGVDFYNDSKSTIAQATLAATQKLQGRPILLILGGLGKNVDRTPLFANLVHVVAHIFCFGAEAELLCSAAHAANIPATHHANLEDLLVHALKKAQPGDQILFSPAGASFDQFQDYKERGNCFKEIVMRHAQTPHERMP